MESEGWLQHGEQPLRRGPWSPAVPLLTRSDANFLLKKVLFWLLLDLPATGFSAGIDTCHVTAAGDSKHFHYPCYQAIVGDGGAEVPLTFKPTE